MAEFVGADTQQLRDLARTFKVDGERLTTVATEVSRQLQSSRWLGADADAFRTRWNGTLRTRLTAAADALLQAGSEVLRNAVEHLASETFDSAAYGSLLQGESWSDISNTIQDIFQGDIPPMTWAARSRCPTPRPSRWTAPPPASSSPTSPT